MQSISIWGVPPRSFIWLEELSLFHFFWRLQTSLLSLFLVLLGWDFDMLVSDLGAVNWLRPFMVLSEIYGISALCGDSSYVALSVLVTKKPFPFPFCSSSLPPLYPLSLHPLSISLLYPISTCDSHPFNTPYLCSHSTLPLYTPYLSSSLPSHSTTPWLTLL